MHNRGQTRAHIRGRARENGIGREREQDRGQAKETDRYLGNTPVREKRPQNGRHAGIRAVKQT